MMTVMQSRTRAEALNRLRYIEGHVAGIRRMIEGDKLCVEIMRQTYAVRRAMQKFEAVLLDRHLHSCVVADVRSGEVENVVAELLRLYQLANK